MSENKCPIEPFQARLVIQKIQEEEVTKGGLYIPDVAKQNAEQEQRKGVVVAVSETSGKYFGIGDIVITGKYSGVKVKELDQEYVILKLDDVQGIIR